MSFYLSMHRYVLAVEECKRSMGYGSGPWEEQATELLAALRALDVPVGWLLCEEADAMITALGELGKVEARAPAAARTFQLAKNELAREAARALVLHYYPTEPPTDDASEVVAQHAEEQS